MAQLLDQKTQVGFLEPTWGNSMSKEVLMASSGFCEHYMHGAQTYMQVKHHGSQRKKKNKSQVI